MAYKIGDWVRIVPAFRPHGMEPGNEIARINNVEEAWANSPLYTLRYLNGNVGSNVWDDQSLELLNGVERIRMRHGL